MCRPRRGLLAALFQLASRVAVLDSLGIPQRVDEQDQQRRFDCGSDPHISVVRGTHEQQQERQEQAACEDHGLLVRVSSPITMLSLQIERCSARRFVHDEHVAILCPRCGFSAYARSQPVHPRGVVGPGHDDEVGAEIGRFARDIVGSRAV